MRQVMLLLASAPRSPFLPNDLSTSGRLQFKVHARELGAQAVQVRSVWMQVDAAAGRLSCRLL